MSKKVGNQTKEFKMATQVKRQPKSPSNQKATVKKETPKTECGDTRRHVSKKATKELQNWFNSL